jgi:hypothetical protein
VSQVVRTKWVHQARWSEAIRNVCIIRIELTEQPRK